MEKVFMAVPCYNRQVNVSLVNGVARAMKDGIAWFYPNSLSLLAHNFNIMYAAALNARKDGATHFLMLHDDISPQEDFWADKLMDEMKKHDADIISVVSPIKSKEGLTSTALEIGDKWKVRRLAMREIYKDYPETFTDEKLLVNTGCMLVDIRKPFADKCFFNIDDEIVCENGVFRPVVMPEDWGFSRMAKSHGAKLFATRAVKIRHHGFNDFPNDQPWGTAETDLGAK